jgi:hypothetical protein
LEGAKKSRSPRIIEHLALFDLGNFLNMKTARKMVGRKQDESAL